MHFSEEHINLMLEISKVYKIMGLLQPDTDDMAQNRHENSMRLSQVTSSNQK